MKISATRTKNNKMIKISVIIPTYNEELSIENVVKDFIKQTILILKKLLRTNSEHYKQNYGKHESTSLQRQNY